MAEQWVVIVRREDGFMYAAVKSGTQADVLAEVEAWVQTSEVVAITVVPANQTFTRLVAVEEGAAAWRSWRPDLTAVNP
jgi:hypothetical protein